MDMEKLHEFANILTRKEEDFETKVEQAANAFSELETEEESKKVQKLFEDSGALEYATNKIANV